MIFANRLGTDQAWQNIGPDLSVLAVGYSDFITENLFWKSEDMLSVCRALSAIPGGGGGGGGGFWPHSQWKKATFFPTACIFPNCMHTGPLVELLKPLETFNLVAIL